MLIKEKLPNSTAVLILGISSILLSFPLGLIPGIIGITMSKKGRIMHNENPDNYDGFKQLNVGYIISIITTAIYCIISLWLIIYSATHAVFDQ
jgi:hypothetical protein